MADPHTAAQFMPHGQCYLWTPEILYVHVISDALIAISYASIPAALIYFVMKRTDLRFSWIFVLFGIFILACGATHLMNIYNTFVPAYYAAGLIKLVCAAASVGTAVVLWPLIPVLLRLPSPSQLESANNLLAHEVEEHKLAREELAVQAEELELQARQLEDINDQLHATNQHLEEFTSVVAHDLQEPLRKIVTFGDMLQRSADENLGEKARERLNRMISASQRMQVLINDLLSYARINHREPDFGAVDLKQIAQDAAENLEDRVRRTGGEIRIESELPTIEADRSHMTQLFQNLIGNGLKFHRQGVPPVVTVRAEPLEQCSLFPGRGWKFQVSDNGIGIPAAYLEQVFGAFERLHSRSEFEGSGIGLTVCRSAVERHGGRITVESVEGEGSTFEFILPETQNAARLSA